MAMNASDYVVGMCEDCNEVNMMGKGMMKLPAAGKCDGCGKPLVWKK